jgi:hypothetical protein
MSIEFWHWLALGFGLLVLEMFLPTGFILLWLGVGAIVVGGIAWIAPGMGWAVEFVLWGVLSVLAVLAWRKFRPMSFSTGAGTPTWDARSRSTSPWSTESASCVSMIRSGASPASMRQPAPRCASLRWTARP